MLSDALNELLTRVGPGTAMGEVFRRFWLPAITSVELPEPDSAPKRLRILGEDLIAFRDSSGKVGLVDAYCPHRLAPLFFGRNEDCGLRCAYHGWKFDVDGKCVDMPNVANSDQPKVRARANITAYPTHEVKGVVWVYMGPSELEPAVPAFEWISMPDDQVHVSRWLQRTNYCVGMEGEIDTSHISFLHKEFDSPDMRLQALAAGRTSDGAPQITLRDTDYGFTYGARRVYGDSSIWRITHWFAPMFSMIPMGPGKFTEANGRAWVPIDDDHTNCFNFAYYAAAMTDDERDYLSSGAAFPPRMAAGTFTLPDGAVIDTFLPASTKENDYQIDRGVQKTRTFTGIWGANDQDRALQESLRSIGAGHPGVVDRRREHLMASDMAIVSARTKLLKMASDIKDGIEPTYPQAAAACAVRAISKICDEQDFDRFRVAFRDDIEFPLRQRADRRIEAVA